MCVQNLNFVDSIPEIIEGTQKTLRVVLHGGPGYAHRTVLYLFIFNGLLFGWTL